MIWRIRSRRVFADLRRSGKRVRSGPVRLTYIPLPTAHPQVAYALGRRFGNAVERNRARRRLRCAFELAWTQTGPEPGAFQLTGSRSLLTADFDRLVGALADCFGQLQPERADR